MITLQTVDAQNWRETLSLAVYPEQQRFVANCIPITAIALAKAYVRSEGMIWFPYGICSDGRMIGFVALAYNAANSRDVWVYHYFIDRQFQGHGYGKQALLVMVAHVQAFVRGRSICKLAHNTAGSRRPWHPKNYSAKALSRHVHG